MTDWTPGNLFIIRIDLKIKVNLQVLIVYLPLLGTHFVPAPWGQHLSVSASQKELVSVLQPFSALFAKAGSVDGHSNWGSVNKQNGSVFKDEKQRALPPSDVDQATNLFWWIRISKCQKYYKLVMLDKNGNCIFIDCRQTLGWNMAYLHEFFLSASTGTIKP